MTGIPNREILHAVAALYDRSLPEVTEDIIYSTVCEKYARTILLVWDKEEALGNFKFKNFSDNQENSCSNVAALRTEDAVSKTCEDETTLSSPSIASKSEETNVTVVQNNLKDQAQQTQKLPVTECGIKNSCRASSATENSCKEHSDEDRFAHVFSDMEASDAEEDNEEDEDFTCGVDDFLKNVAKRKEKRGR